MSSRDHPDWWRPMGGQNSQDSILERRSLVWNDNGILDGTVPDNFYEAEREKGKFFPRGCRGMIEEIQLYCIGDGADIMTIYLSPHPNLGPIHAVQLTPAAAWAWQAVAIETMWDYDSLFIWVIFAEANVDWAYDAELPYDGHVTTDVGATWSATATRPFFRVVYTGETPGDVPVSGIINNIEIPSVAAELLATIGYEVPHDTGVIGLITAGIGTLLEVKAQFHSSVVPTPGEPPAGVVYEIRFYVDGERVETVSNRDLTQSCVATSGRSSIGEFWQCTVAEPAYDRTFLNVRLPLQFRRTIFVGFYQSTGGPIDVDYTLHGHTLQ